MSQLSVMDRTGDHKTIWDPARPDEVQAARATFQSLRAKGYIAYRVNEAGDKGEILREFDAQAGKIILTPPLVGG